MTQDRFAGATILFWLMFTMAAGASPPGGSVYSLRARNDSSPDYPFLPEWEPNLVAGPPGCITANTGHWTWRVSGLGCNMTLLLSAYLYWVYGWGWTNLAIIIGEHFDRIECGARATTLEVSGWDCIFRPMPHVCTFRTLEEYSSFLIEQGATQETVNDSLQITNHDTWKDPRGQPYSGFKRSPHPSSMGSRNMVARHVWRHFQPWVEGDIRMLNACMPQGIREGPYIGLHIRRGDKVLSEEADLTPAEDYLKVAVSALLRRNEECSGAKQLLLNECKTVTPLLPEHIEGLYVASDDGLVVREIRELSPMFLPNVTAENVVYMSDGKENAAAGTDRTPCRRIGTFLARPGRRQLEERPSREQKYSAGAKAELGNKDTVEKRDTHLDISESRNHKKLKAECSIGAQEVKTRVYKQGYPAMIYLLHDIDVLTKADIFVGTFSSNLGRFITTLRGETKGSFGAEPDERWRPN